ncbi:hypothetical protein PORY_002118 [Pneumocystis oryctolagi]|uniref:Uncharacterized protein n=1 Tax=Pneumocystis oryctolagi TaxID=42067 RepID=A0ACB7CA23_9ASCO|nr:hypothetical protein PORY_002118 [Pneumocystis oryctolagi]
MSNGMLKYTSVSIKKPLSKLKPGNVFGSTEEANSQVVRKKIQWPDSLKEFVGRCFENCSDKDRPFIEKELKEIITKAFEDDTVFSIDWDKIELKTLKKQKKQFNGHIQSNKVNKVKTEPSNLNTFSISETEHQKEKRIKRFEQKDKIKTSNEILDVDTSSHRSDVIDWDEHTIVGKSQQLEKKYLRLTSAPDPETVRPLPVLKKTLEFLKAKWKEENNYLYICDQFKSLRQDLTVQRIKNDFTVMVYEIHARIALEKGDLGEYNQCQTQLFSLYSYNLPGHPDEFLAYRILYLLHTRNKSDIHEILLKLTEEEKKNHAVKHALDVRAAFGMSNYHSLFRLYLDAPNMGGYLMDCFVERERVIALCKMFKAYRPSLSLKFLCKELSFENESECFEFLLVRSNKDIFTRDEQSKSIYINTKDALEYFEQAKLKDKCILMVGSRKSQKSTNRKDLVANIAPKSATSIEPPKKVIKALYDYVSQSSVELAFSKGDFFYVIGNENDENWYEACNPTTNVRGLVPVSYFQVLGKTERDVLNTKNLEKSSEKNHTNQVSSKTQSLYGIVQYDFHAERPDELEAQAGEAIIVIAHSNHEWFVAKPIGRLGGPGLIPVSFIEIRDFSTGKAVTNVQELVNSMAIPRVEEWKKMAAEYKKNSISLGKFNFDEDSSNKSNSASISQNNQNIDSSKKCIHNTKIIHEPFYHNNEEVCVVSSRVIKHVYSNERYQYLVYAEMENSCYRNLFRYYEDFYNLQVMLLDEFPVEAGRTGKRRILPYMPIPLSYVDDQISQRRCIDLDTYLRDLCRLPSYIRKSSLVTNFFSLRECDIESNTPITMIQPSCTELSDEIVEYPGSKDSILDCNDLPSSPNNYKKSVSESQLSSNLSFLPLSSKNFGISSRSVSTESQYDYELSKLTETFQSSSIQKDESAYSPISRTLKECQIQISRSFSQDNTLQSGIYSDSSYVKIKIYFLDDLIAIRVPRQITFIQLMEKLQGRLGTKIKSLRCKETNDHLYLIKCDNDLRNAINKNSKLVLYAE